MDWGAQTTPDDRASIFGPFPWAQPKKPAVLPPFLDAADANAAAQADQDNSSAPSFQGTPYAAPNSLPPEPRSAMPNSGTSGAQTADPNEPQFKAPEKTARMALPPEMQNGGAMPPAINAASGPNLPADVQGGRVAVPNANDYKPQPLSTKRRVLNGIFSGLEGFSNPHGGMEYAEYLAQAPERKAHQAFENDLGQYDRAEQQGARMATPPPSRSVTVNGDDQVQDYVAGKGWTAEPGVTPFEKPPASAKPETRNVTVNGQTVVQDYDPATKTWKTEAGVTPYEKPEQPPKPAAPSAAILAQIGEEPAAGQKNSKGLTREQWGAKAQTLGAQPQVVIADARGKAYAQNRMYQVLDTENGNRPKYVTGAEINADPDRYVTQAGGEKSLPKEALINDISQSAANVRKNIAVLDSSGIDRATLAASLANPDTTVESYLQALPRGALNDQQQQFVADLFNLREQAMAMRSVLGAGQGSEDVRKAIISTLPGIASNSKMAAKQLDNLDAVLKRIEQGVPDVPLNAPKTGGGNAGGGAGGVTVQAGGKTYSFPNQEAADKAKKEMGIR